MPSRSAVQPHRFRQWTWLAIVFSMAVCGAILGLYYQQREIGRRTQRVLATLRQARIDLGNGILHLALAGDPRSPYRREEGLALLEQSLASLQPMLASEPSDPADREAAERMAAFERKLAECRSLLEADKASTPAERPQRELRLRLALHELDRFTSQVDELNRQQLQSQERATDRQFTLTLACAIVLLGGVCVYVYAAGRREYFAARALRRSEELIRVVGDNLPESYVYRYYHDPAGRPRFVYVSAGVERLHGLTVEEVQRDAMSLLSQIDPKLRAAHLAAERKSAQELSVFEMILPMRRTDGQWRTLHVRSRPARQPDGNLVWDGVATDMTERVKLEADMRRKDLWLQEMSAMAHVGGWDFDPATGEGGWTDEVARIHDMDPAEATSRDIGLSVYQGESRRLIEQALAAATERGESYDLELEMITHAGRRKWVHTQGRAVMEDGRVVRLRGSIQDITDRKLAELALREEKDRLAKVAAMSPSVVHSFRQGKDGRFSFPYASPRIRDLYGVEPELLAADASCIAESWHPDDVPQLFASIAESRRTMSPWTGEFRVRHPTRGERWIQGHSMPTADSDGGVTWHGVLTDVTERKREAVALQESEARFRTLFEQAADGIFIFGRNGQYEDANQRAAEMVGYTREELIGAPVGTLTPVARRQDLQQIQRRIFSGETVVAEWLIRRKDGSTVEVEIASRRLSDGRGLSFVRDVTERKQAASRATLHHTVTLVLAEGGPLQPTFLKVLEQVCQTLHWEFGAWWTLDRTTKKLRCSTQWQIPARNLSELAEVTRTTALESGRGLPGQVWARGAPLWLQEVRLLESPRQHALAAAQLQDGIGFPVLVRGELHGVMEFFSARSRPPDTAMLELFGTLGAQLGQFIERHRLEEEIRQTQKLEAIGTLASGIAHDFNNILAGIICYTSLAQMAAKGNPTLEEYLQEVAHAGARAADLVRQILAFSRRQEQQRTVVQLRHIVAESVKLLRATLPSTIELATSLPADLPPVLADSTQIHQVIMNLGTNAWHAMRDRAGRLKISAEKVALDETSAASHAIKPGDYVRISVQDTGHGMDAATCERIFEPFFTTKPRGEGTGLGLAVVHGIVRNHGGAITVESEVDVGTTFHLLLPASPAAELPAAPSPTRLPRGHGELIVVVDDEETILQSMQQLLELFGYRAIGCAHPQQALERIPALGVECALVLTDHTLPGFTGLELASKLRAAGHRMPIVLSTGYAANLTEDKMKAAGVSSLLPKPFTPESVLTVLQGLLAPKRARSTS